MVGADDLRPAMDDLRPAADAALERRQDGHRVNVEQHLEPDHRHLRLLGRGELLPKGHRVDPVRHI